MFIDNETDGGAEESTNDNHETGSNTDLKQEIESLRNQNAELSQTMKAFMASQQQKNETKPLSKEEIADLYTKAPAPAIEYTMPNQINNRVNEVARTLSVQQDAKFYDEKAERDFPLINKDKQFKQLVQNETRRLIELGVPKDSPKLVYEAASNAAKNYKLSQETKSGENRSISGEAPTNISKKSVDGKLSKNQEKLAAMFNASDKVKARVIENNKFRDQVEARRRGGN